MGGTLDLADERDGKVLKWATKYESLLAGVP